MRRAYVGRPRPGRQRGLRGSPTTRAPELRAETPVEGAATISLGRDEVFAQFGRYGGETGGIFKADLKWLATDDEGRVVGVHHNTGERNGKLGRGGGDDPA